jgi:hypothetical protein
MKLPPWINETIMKQHHAYRLGGFVLMAVLIGCSTQRSRNTQAQTPLTLDAWKQLPPTQKYEIATLERLKEGEPTLKEPREWDTFTRTVLLPSKRKEQPQR